MIQFSVKLEEREGRIREWDRSAGASVLMSPKDKHG